MLRRGRRAERGVLEFCPIRYLAEYIDYVRAKYIGNVWDGAGGGGGGLWGQAGKAGENLSLGRWGICQLSGYSGVGAIVASFVPTE